MRYCLYWRDGKKEIVKGSSISNAITKAGYGPGALQALDYYEPIEPTRRRRKNELDTETTKEG